jgi:HlyD family secretion protein
MMRRIVSIVAVGLLVGAGIWGYSYARSRDGAPKYRLTRLDRGPLTAAVSATGNLNAVITVQVGSQVSGQIKELLADFNTIVKKNQVIARIDPEIFQTKVNQAKADLDSSLASVVNQEAQVDRARADVENARAAALEGKAQTAKAQVTVVDSKRTLDRSVALFGQDLVAASDRDTAQAGSDAALAQHDSAEAHDRALAAGINAALSQLHVQEAAVTTARAQGVMKKAVLQQAQVDLDHATITAPVDGMVVSRAVDVGQTVAASLQAPVLFTIAQDLTKMQVETSVDEADIGKIPLGGAATFTVDAFPGESFSGRVTQIRKAAQVVQNVVTYAVMIAVANPTGKLLPGMTANVRVVTAEKPSVLRVSNAALRFRPAGAEAQGGGASSRPAKAPSANGGRVYVLGADGKPTPVIITLGITDGTTTEILQSELKEGQEVIIGLAGSTVTTPQSPGATSPRLRL